MYVCTLFKKFIGRGLFLPCSEKIFGYRGLEVQLYYTPGGLRTFVGVRHTDKVDPATSGGLKVCGRNGGEE